jgi:aspartate/methionine/tyrosine aminotransferase
MVYARNLEAQGEEITYLNIGDPVKFGFDTPQTLKTALKEAVMDGFNYYSPSLGLPELREAISEKKRSLGHANITANDVVVTTGVSEAILMITAALVETNDDEILIPGPTYPPYAGYTNFFGGKPIVYRTSEENGWQPDVEDIKNKFSDSTRAIIIVNPNNPCGSVYSDKTLKEIVDLAGENKALVISDEIYNRIVYEKRFVSTSSIADDVPVICLDGFSKTYAAPGWRLGTIYFHDPEEKIVDIKNGIEKQTNVRLCANTPIQKAAALALKESEGHVTEMVNTLRARRDYAWNRLKNIEGISCVKPEGAFYLFPKFNRGSRWRNDEEFVLGLLREKRILFVHGSGFGEEYGKDHFRTVFLPSIDLLGDVFDRLEDYMSSH